MVPIPNFDQNTASILMTIFFAAKLNSQTQCVPSLFPFFSIAERMAFLCTNLQNKTWIVTFFLEFQFLFFFFFLFIQLFGGFPTLLTFYNFLKNHVSTIPERGKKVGKRGGLAASYIQQNGVQFGNGKSLLLMTKHQQLIHLFCNIINQTVIL